MVVQRKDLPVRLPCRFAYGTQVSVGVRLVDARRCREPVAQTEIHISKPKSVRLVLGNRVRRIELEPLPFAALSKTEFFIDALQFGHGLLVDFICLRKAEWIETGASRCVAVRIACTIV